jgi:VCBS repeat-containing protein
LEFVMADSIAVVASLEGQAWAKSSDGTLRPLKVGDSVSAEEVVVTATGARIELDFGDGKPVAIAGGQEVLMGNDLWVDLAADKQDAAVDDASVQEALRVLNEGGDLTEVLEETAAGLEGGGAGEGHSFVELTRVVENTSPNAFSFGAVNNGAERVPATFQSSNQINQAPQVDAQSFSGDEDTIINGQVIATDIENDVLSYSLLSQPANGTVTLNSATGSFVYTPNANYNGPDSFLVTVTDDNGNSTTATIGVTIAPVNDAPVSSNQNLSTQEDTSVSGQVIASDIEGDTLTYSITSNATNGTVTLNAATGTFVYTPNANYNGSDNFVVTISDGNGGTTTSLITIGVTPVNDAPISNNQSLVTDEDVAINGQVIASDVDGDTLNYSITANATNGSVALNPATGAFVYTPNTNFNGSDSFVVTISDGNGGTATSLITIGVTPVNDAPVSSNLNLTTLEDTPVNGQVNATDVDGDTLAYSVSGQPTKGSVTLNLATGSFVYTPNTNYNGSDSFVVTISDGKGGTTSSVVSIGVTPVNDAPVASNLNLTTNEDTPVNGSIGASDPDSDILSFGVTGAPTNGTVVLNTATGTFTYTPNTGYSGGDSFVVTVSDGNGGTTTSTVNIGINTIVPINQAPTANNDFTTTDESTAVIVAVRSNDTDPDGDSLTVSAVTQGSNGSVVIDAVTGNPIYTPNAGFAGTDNFTYAINDSNGHTATANVRVEVNAIAVPVNQAPVAVADSFTVAEGGTLNGTSVLSNDTDAEGNPLTAILVSGPAHGSLTLNANGTFSYLHDGSETTADSFTYKVNDGTVDGNTVTVSIGITPVNDAPVAVADPVGIAYSVKLGDASASDLWSSLDSKGLSVAVNGYNADGTAGTLYLSTIDDNTNTLGVSGTPRTVTEQVPEQIEYDQTIGKSEALELVLNGNVSQASFSVSRLFPGENGGELGMWSAYYQGALVAQSSFRLFDSSDAGSFTIDTGGLVFNSVKFIALNTSDATGDGSDYFLTGFSAGGDASINTDYSLAEGATLNIGSASSLKLTSNDTDAEGHSLVVSKINGVDITNGQSISLTYGDLIINTDGSFSYSANNASQLFSGQVATDSFTYTISDGHGGTATATAILTVIGRDLTGTSGNDTLVGGSYSEQIVGGLGDDTMTGGLGADTFKWSLNDQGSKGTPAVDTVTDFNMAQGDVLDLKDLLQSENSGNLTNFLHFSSDGINTTVSISSTGSFDGANYSAVTDQTIVLNNVNLTGGDTTTIINLLKTNGNLITD